MGERGPRHQKQIPFSAEEVAFLKETANRHGVTVTSVVKEAVWALRRARAVTEGHLSITDSNATATDGFRLAGEIIYPWPGDRSSNDNPPTTLTE